MKIGISGAGHIGATLTRRLTTLGHQVFVANSRGPETLADLAAETGATAVRVPEAVRGIDLVVVTIPEKRRDGFRFAHDILWPAFENRWRALDAQPREAATAPGS
jgi:lactate dehydrogenase-like 2-hydroxyacid dehydrogenase